MGPLTAIRGLAFVVHPFPALMNAVAGTAFFVYLTGAARWLDAAMLFGSICLIHASIGSMNDYCDVDLDRHTKPRKPIARGDLRRHDALAVSVMAAAVGVLSSLWFGWPTVAVALVVLAAGMAYDFWAKGSVWSWLPYAVFIPAVPVWSFLAAGAFTPVVLWSFPLGTLIALALNIANTLPDLPGDLQHGIKGLAHRLGLRRSIVLAWCAFAGAIALLAAMPAISGNDGSILFPGIALGAILLLAMIADYSVNRSTGSLKRGWYGSAVLAAILGGAWVASLPAA